MNPFFALLLIMPFFFAASCGNDEKGSIKDMDPESVYFDYKIWGEESSDIITVKLQYRFGDENGESILLEGPSKVELDGEVLEADSAKLTGVYYEVQKPVTIFSGEHTITFTDFRQKKYRETFTFQPVTLTKPVPASIKRGDLVFEFTGLSSGDLVRVLMTDTSFSNEEINRVDSVKNGRIIIAKEELMGLSNGPIHLEIIKEYGRDVKNGTKVGGRLSIFYGLRREFILED